MDAAEYQKQAMKTAATLDTVQSVINAALGLAGEAGEVADLVKKSLFQGHPLDEARIKDELGDLLWYVALMCRAVGTDMDSVMQGNIAKLRNRYGTAFSVERSVNRED